MAGYLRYPVTNESMLAINAGLDPQPNDNILCVGGSADQAFALASYGAKVVIVDTCPLQISYINKRLEYLLNGDHKKFLQPPGYSKEFKEYKIQFSIKERDDYFSKECFDGIRQNIGNITVLNPQCIIYHAHQTPNTYSKAYLSNSIEHIVNNDKRLQNSKERFEDELTYLRSTALSLKPNGSIYISRATLELYNNIGIFLPNNFLHQLLEIDIQKTGAARFHESRNSGAVFEPLVFSRRNL